MNILLLFTYQVSLKDWYDSGIIERELALYKKLNAKYNTEFIFLTYGDESDFEYVKDYNFIKVLPLHQFLDKKNNRLMDIFNQLLSIKKILDKFGNFDIIKTNQLNGVWLGLLIKLLFKKPLFVRTGYDLFLFSIKEKKVLYKKIFYYLLTWSALLFSNLYSVSSETDFKYINKIYFFPKKKFLIRRNWVEINEYKDFKDRKSDKFLSVGRLESQKDFEFLIKKLNNKKVQLDIVGNGSQLKYLSEISSDNINFLGTYDHTNLMNIYNNYKFYITSTNYEGNPKSLIEAMSKGCVVIAPKNENIDEVIKNNETGIIYDKENFDVDHLLIKLSSKNSEKISKNAYNFILNNYSIDNAIEVEFQDYLNCLNEKF